MNAKHQIQTDAFAEEAVYVKVHWGGAGILLGDDPKAPGKVAIHFNDERTRFRDAKLIVRIDHASEADTQP